MVVSIDGVACGCIGLMDSPRPEAAKAISTLQSNGISVWIRCFVREERNEGGIGVFFDTLECDRARSVSCSNVLVSLFLHFWFHTLHRCWSLG